ncbi:MAG: hypothetical protein AOA65_1449 [Candidatus Bathyarchaeota archaeon BA1]|nr:MAG: hypothetical protein AOA65_1449 [Candidatus Bathyarchaeota archaeon BA1]
MEFWPYILPLPRDRADQRRFLISIFGSDTALDILRNVSLQSRVYQKDLIKGLKYSNKTIIQNLKTLVSLGVLQEGMEKVLERGRVFWLKWYLPTSIGKWIVLLLLPPEKVDAKLVEETLRELFELYVKNAIELCKTYDLSLEILKSVFEESFPSLQQPFPSATCMET